MSGGADAERAGFGFVDKVLAKVDVTGIAGVAAKCGEGAKRFGAVAFAGELVGGGDDTAATGAGGAEDDFAEAEARPGVLGERFTAGEDEVGTKAVHRNGFSAAGDEAIVEVGEGGFAYGEKRVAVGEGEKIVADETTFDLRGVGGERRWSEGGFVEDRTAKM